MHVVYPIPCKYTVPIGDTRELRREGIERLLFCRSHRLFHWRGAGQPPWTSHHQHCSHFSWRQSLSACTQAWAHAAWRIDEGGHTGARAGKRRDSPAHSGQKRENITECMERNPYRSETTFPASPYPYHASFHISAAITSTNGGRTGVRMWPGDRIMSLSLTSIQCLHD